MQIFRNDHVKKWESYRFHTIFQSEKCLKKAIKPDNNLQKIRKLSDLSIQHISSCITLTLLHMKGGRLAPHWYNGQELKNFLNFKNVEKFGIPLLGSWYSKTLEVILQNMHRLPAKGKQKSLSRTFKLVAGS